MVFQNYALYPHMTVAREHGVQPCGCGDGDKTLTDIESPGQPRRAISWASIQAARPLTPSELSGGQRQRVAIGPRLGA